VHRTAGILPPKQWYLGFEFIPFWRRISARPPSASNASRWAEITSTKGEKMECVMLILIGLIPPFIAIENPKTKVNDFILWWIFGTFLFFIALPLAIYKQVQKQKKSAWLATRWKRFWGATIDSLLQLVLLILFLLATGILQRMIEMRDITYREQVTINGLNLLAFTLLNGFLLYSK